VNIRMMFLFKKQPVNHPLEDFGLSHAPLSQQHYGHTAAFDGIQRCLI
jgi:hypothetical protein